jgi:hypothetical protein
VLFTVLEIMYLKVLLLQDQEGIVQCGRERGQALQSKTTGFEL